MTIELPQTTSGEQHNCDSLSAAVGVRITQLASSERGSGWVQVSLPDDVVITDTLKASLKAALLAGRTDAEDA